MAYPQQGPGGPAMSATFVPGGYDDFYMPNPGPELVAPAPQKYVPPRLSRPEDSAGAEAEAGEMLHDSG